MELKQIIENAKYKGGVRPYEEGFNDACDRILREYESSQLKTLVMPKAEFTPIVAHVVIKNKEAENKLERILNDNEFYIDYTQSLLSYKAEQK